MKLNQHIIVSLLILLIAAPLDTAAAAGMANGMGAVTSVNAQIVNTQIMDHDELVEIPAKVTVMAQSSHHPEASHAPSPSETTSNLHHDDAEVCDDHCMNCSSHCYSSALVTGSSHFLGTENHFALTFTSDTLDRAYLLFRPPIHA